MCSYCKVSKIYDLPGVVNLLHVFAAQRLEAVLFLSLDQQSGIYCPMILRDSVIDSEHRLNSYKVTGHYGALGHWEGLRNHALQIDIIGLYFTNENVPDIISYQKL